MKILVTVKRVLDHNVRVRLNAEQTDVDLSNNKMVINPFCEIAVEEALRLKEKYNASEVIVISVGPKAVQEQIRAALALGADRGIHIETEQSLEPLGIAKTLHHVIKQEQPDLILMGKQSIDQDNNQTGQMLAALAGLPQGTFASQLHIENNKIFVTREVDSGSQTLALDLPALVTCDLRLNEPRFASLVNVMKAKRKPLITKNIDELNIKIKANTKLLRVDPPKTRKPGIMLNSVDELVEKLKYEAGVI
jgi:electron transfer flavoprotein beta subunit